MVGRGTLANYQRMRTIIDVRCYEVDSVVSRIVIWVEEEQFRKRHDFVSALHASSIGLGISSDQGLPGPSPEGLCSVVSPSMVLRQCCGKHTHTS